MLMHRSGWKFKGACGRSLESAERACRAVGAGEAVTDPAPLARGSSLVLITTPDDSIGDACSLIAERGATGADSVVAHCSGALTSSVLRPARLRGAHTGSLHPIQSFAGPEEAVKTLPGAYCCIEGDGTAEEVLVKIASDLGLHPLRIATDRKPLYHAGMVMASNFMASLHDIALELECEAGLEAEDALKAFMPLVRGTLENMAKLGPARALTGPFARGDCETVRLHLEHIRRHCPKALSAYLSLGRRALELGIKQGGVDPSDARAMRDMLKGRS